MLEVGRAGGGRAGRCPAEPAVAGAAGVRGCAAPVTQTGVCASKVPVSVRGVGSGLCFIPAWHVASLGKDPEGGDRACERPPSRADLELSVARKCMTCISRCRWKKGTNRCWGRSLVEQAPLTPPLSGTAAPESDCALLSLPRARRRPHQPGKLMSGPVQKLVEDAAAPPAGTSLPEWCLVQN